VLGAAVKTLPMRLLLAFTESREAVNALAADVASFDPLLSGLSGAVPQVEWFADEWQRLTGITLGRVMPERLYQLTQVKPPMGVTGAARRAGGSDRELLMEWLTAFDLEAFGTIGGDIGERVDAYFEMATRGMFIWEDGGPASMAAFGGLTRHGARIGPVYTPPDRRGHGYASAITAWLSQHLLDEGRQFCCLFTDLANPTSNHIYQTIGYVPVRDVEYRFTSASA